MRYLVIALVLYSIVACAVAVRGTEPDADTQASPNEAGSDSAPLPSVVSVPCLPAWSKEKTTLDGETFSTTTHYWAALDVDVAPTTAPAVFVVLCGPTQPEATLPLRDTTFPHDGPVQSPTSCTQVAAYLDDGLVLVYCGSETIYTDGSPTQGNRWAIAYIRIER